MRGGVVMMTIWLFLVVWGVPIGFAPIKGQRKKKGGNVRGQRSSTLDNILPPPPSFSLYLFGLCAAARWWMNADHRIRHTLKWRGKYLDKLRFDKWSDQKNIYRPSRKRKDDPSMRMRKNRSSAVHCNRKWMILRLLIQLCAMVPIYNRWCIKLMYIQIWFKQSSILHRLIVVWWAEYLLSTEA